MTSNNGHDPRCHTTPLTLKDVEPKKRTQVAPEFRLASRSGREVGSSEICPSLPILPRRSGTERPPTPRGEEATESPSTRITRNSRGERLHCGLATQVEIHRRLESKVNGVECHPPGVGRKNRTQRVRGNLVLPPARAIPALQNRAWFKPFGARVTLFLMYGRAVLATKDVRAKASGQVAEGFTPPSV